MDRKKSQFGSVHLIVIIFFVMLTLSVLGYLAWNNFLKPSQSNAKKVSPVVIKKDNSVANNYKTYASKIAGLKAFKYPADWMVSSIYESGSGVLFKSSDFMSERELYKIKNGAALSISVSVYEFDDNDEDLISEAMAVSNLGLAGDYSLVDLNGERVVKFLHSSGENRNNQAAALFFRHNLKYEIIEQYGLEFNNSYPNLLDEIVLNMQFEN